MSDSSVLNQTAYLDGAAQGIDALAPGVAAGYGNAAEQDQITSASWGGVNGSYGTHAYSGMPVPVGMGANGRLYVLAANSLVAFGSKVNPQEPGSQATQIAPMGDPAPEARSVDAVTELQAEIDRLFDGSAPIHLLPGLRYMGVSETRVWVGNADLTRMMGRYGIWSFETLIPLLRAYRYVDPEHQQKIRTYVLAEWQNYGPPAGISQLPLSSPGGVSRNFGAPPPDAVLPTTGAWWESWEANRPWSVQPLHWYCAWLIHEVLGESANGLYDQLAGMPGFSADYAALPTGFFDGAFAKSREGLNAHISGLYGRWRLEAVVYGEDDARTLATKALLDRLLQQWWTLLDPNTTFPALDFAGGNSRNGNASHQWLWLMPEAMALLESAPEHSPAKVEAVLAQVDRLAPFWDTRDFPAGIGEGMFTLHHDYPAIFNAKALMGGVAPQELRRHVDAQVWAIGDHDYWNALVTLLDVENSGTPTPAPTAFPPAEMTP